MRISKREVSDRERITEQDLRYYETIWETVKKNFRRTGYRNYAPVEFERFNLNKRSYWNDSDWTTFGNQYKRNKR